MLKLLIAVDGSEPAQRAIEAAGKLARQTSGAEVVLLNVSDGPSYYGELPPFDYESLERLQRVQQEQLLDAALAHARQCGLSSASTQSAVGLAAQEIVRVAEERGVDQIIMGSRGRSAIGGLLLGSVAQRVIHLAKVPVLVVR